MEFLLFLETLSKKILTLGKSISLAIDNDVVVDDKDAVPTAFSLGLGGILMVVKR
jgi:hypothetical protein